VPNFVLIGQTVAEIWPFIRILKMVAVRHLELKNEILVAIAV